MAKFKYRARDQQGKEKQGQVEAKSSEEATALLVKQRLFVTEITSLEGQLNISFLRKKVSLKDKIIFTEQLAVMIRAGLSVVDAIKSLRSETNSRELGEALDQIVIDVEGGLAFSEALKKHPKIFDQVFHSIVASGEQSGKLDEVLERLAQQMDKSYDLVSKVRGALIYPIVIFVALIGVGVFVMIYIIPKLSDTFKDSGAEMPAVTLAIVAISVSLAQFWYYYLVGIILLVFTIYYFLRTPKGQFFGDGFKLKIPVFGSLFKKAYMANFCRTFSSLSASGLPILEIFKVVKNVIPNQIYLKEIDKMSKEIESGIPLSKTLHQSAIFPSMIGQLALVGEKSGQMDEVFNTLANFYEREVENITKNLSALIEPLMMLILGTGIGVLMIAVLQPIYGLVGAI